METKAAHLIPALAVATTDVVIKSTS